MLTRFKRPGIIVTRKTWLLRIRICRLAHLIWFQRCLISRINMQNVPTIFTLLLNSFLNSEVPLHWFRFLPLDPDWRLDRRSATCGLADFLIYIQFLEVFISNRFDFSNIGAFNRAVQIVYYRNSHACRNRRKNCRRNDWNQRNQLLYRFWS